MFPIPFLIFFISVVVICVVKILSKNYDYFEKRGIKYVKPYLLIGTNYWMFQRKALPEFMLQKCEEFKSEKIFGLFDFQTPALVVNDPEIIKQITVKDFEHFTDRRTFLNPKPKSFAANMLLMMKGKRWHEMCTGLTPIFTSSKMRLMFELVSNCGQQLVNNLSEEIRNADNEITYDMKSLCTKYTCDVIASCAFGFQSDSIRDPNNILYSLGKSLLLLRTPKTLAKILMIRFLPGLAELLDISVVDKKASKSFYELIVRAMADREKNGVVRPDMISLLMQLKKGHLKPEEEDVPDLKRSWTNEELVPQCFVFFTAGFETVSTLLVFTAYELAVNPDIQERLREEILDIKRELDNPGSVTYDHIQGMKYMDMVISEALRKWPPAPVLDRLCTKTYQYKKDQLNFQVEQNDLIWIPIYSVHHNPEYYPNPEKFDPERFSAENKQNIDAKAYLPFGEGPRICIGSRFAIMEAKTVLFHLLSKFTLEISKQTVVPVKLKGSVLGMAPDKPVLLTIKHLNE